MGGVFYFWVFRFHYHHDSISLKTVRHGESTYQMCSSVNESVLMEI